MAKKKAIRRAAGQQPTTEDKKKPSNVLKFPAGRATLSPSRPRPEPGVVKSQAPKKKKGKVLEIVPKVIRAEEMKEWFDLHTQMQSAVEKFLQKDRWIGAALIAGATVEKNKKLTQIGKDMVLTYEANRPSGSLTKLRLAALQGLVK